MVDFGFSSRIRFWNRTLYSYILPLHSVALSKAARAMIIDVRFIMIIFVFDIAKIWRNFVINDTQNGVKLSLFSVFIDF